MTPDQVHSDKAIHDTFGKLLDDGMLILDTDLNITEANSAAIRYLGENLLGRGVAEVLDSPAIEEEAMLAMAEDKPTECLSGAFHTPHRQFRVKFRRIDTRQIAMLMMDMTLQRNLEKVRRDFVANVSHELRSPLTSLIGFVETMQASIDLDATTRQRFLGIMGEESKRMSRLIEDLLSLTRVETDEHIAPTDRVFIQHVVTRVIASMSNRAEKSGRSIVFRDTRDNKAGGLVVLGDNDSIVEIFHNLLDNAIKYGHPGSDIDVVLAQDDSSSIRFDVINIGDGIPEAHLERLTERFYRVDKGRSRQMGGTGLGLAIVKHIIKRHRGQLGITSTPGAETVFSVTLPLHLDGW